MLSFAVPQLSDDKNQKWTFFDLKVQSDTSVDDSLMSLYLYLSIGISVLKIKHVYSLSSVLPKEVGMCTCIGHQQH